MNAGTQMLLILMAAVQVFFGFILGDLWRGRKFHRGMLKALKTARTLEALDALEILQKEFYD